jgi:two-component system chemotaxis sensor kinase CheA
MAFDRKEFLSTFSDEARDHLQKLNEGLLALEKNPDDPAVVEEMFREAHTLKGAARMMTFNEIKEISHCIEDIFGAIHNKQITLDAKQTNVLFAALDKITEILEQIIAGEPVTEDWEKTVEALQGLMTRGLDQKKKSV